MCSTDPDPFASNKVYVDRCFESLLNSGMYVVAFERCFMRHMSVHFAAVYDAAQPWLERPAVQDACAGLGGFGGHAENVRDTLQWVAHQPHCDHP